MKIWLPGSIIVIFLLFVGWVFSEAIHATSSSRGAGLDYDEFREQMPPPGVAKILDIHGEEHIALFGRIRTPLAFPSGPPVYIFDREGKFIDWTLDVGENQQFREKWLRVESRDITIDQADQMIQANRKIEQGSDGNAEKPPGVERTP